MSLFFDLVIPTAALAGLAAIFIVLFYYCRRRFLVYQESSQYQINQLQRKTLDFGLSLYTSYTAVLVLIIPFSYSCLLPVYASYASVNRHNL